MENKEILEKWKAGLTKETLAKIYRREYNMQIRNIRAEVRNRYSGGSITNYEALSNI